MKTFFTALVALTVSLSSNAADTHSEKCPNNCEHALSMVAPAAPSVAVRSNLASEAAAENLGTLNYNLGMQTALNKLEEEKLRNALADLDAMQSFNRLMHATLTRVTEEKKADILEDLAAEERYEKLMTAILNR